MPPTPTGFALRRRDAAVLRGAGFAAAVLLGALAVWLIVTSESKKSLEIGILTGLWGLLLGTYAVFGSRLPVRDPEPPATAPQPARDLEVRTSGEIERAAIAAARREFHDELQLLLRQEVHAGVAQEVANLRAEVAALRSELVEKVGGQLRLERIETTRLIGSDLEAVQSELRKLRQTAPDVVPVPAVPVATPARAVTDATIHDAEVHDDADLDGPEIEDEIQDAEIVPDEPVAVRPAAPVNGSRAADPFAELPRLTPFTEFELDPIEDDDPRRGRRHRADDAGNDVLARILAREQR